MPAITLKPEFLTIQQWRVLVDVAQGTGWLRSLPDHAQRTELRR